MAEDPTSGPEYDGQPADPVINLDEEPAPSKQKGLVLSAEDEDAPNLVTILKGSQDGIAILQKLGERARTDFDTDWDAGEVRREQDAQDWRIFAGDLPKKEWPFANCANLNVPIMFENLTRIHATCFGELFGDWSQIFSVLPVGPDDDDVADILTKHGNWQFTEQITDFYRQASRAMLFFFTSGDVVSKSYYDSFSRQNCHSVLTRDEFVTPFVHVTTKPDFSDLPHYCAIDHKHRHQIQAETTWEFVEETLARKPSFSDDPEQVQSEVIADASGQEIPEDSQAAPYKIIEYYGWTDLLPTALKRDRFVKITLDYATKNVLCLEIYEEENWQDKQRFLRQQNEAQQYQQATDAHAQIQQEAQAGIQQLQGELDQAHQSGIAMDPNVVQQRAQALQSKLDPRLFPPPPPPAWTQDQSKPGSPPNLTPAPVRKEAIHCFVHAVCIEPMKGNIGLGYGRMQADFNRADNIMLNQVVDSATLDNAQSIITAGDLGFKRPFSRSPGAINVANVPPSKLKESIYELQRNGANPQMFELIDRIFRYAQTSAQAEDVLSGAPGKSGETKGGIQYRGEQALKQLSVPTRTFARTWLKPVIMNNARLNAIYLPEDEVVMINNDRIGDAPEALKMGRKLYERDYRVTFVADLRFASRDQRVAEADEVTQMFLTLPKAGLPPNLPAVQKAMAKSLQARGRSDMVPYLGQELPPPQTPMAVQPPQPQVAPPGTPPPQQAQPPAALPATG